MLVAYASIPTALAPVALVIDGFLYVPISTTRANIHERKEHHLANQPHTGAPHKISDWAVRKLVRRIAKDHLKRSPEKNSAYDPKNTIPTVKFGAESILIWGCFSSQGTARIQIIKEKMNGVMYWERICCHPPEQ